MLSEYRPDIEDEDIIGYFITEEDAIKAKKAWDNASFLQKNPITRIHQAHAWESADDFTNFWLKMSDDPGTDEEEHF
jgi:hypothetical protein